MNALALTPARIFTMPERPPSHETQRDYRALRRAVRHDPNLSFGAKTFFEDVCDLAYKHGFCWAENEHFVESLNVTDRAVRGWISDLIDAGYLRKGLRAGRRVLVPLEAEENAVSEPVSQERNASSARNEISAPRNVASAEPGNAVPAPSISPPPEGEREARARTRVRGILGYEPDGLRAITANQPVAVALYTALVGRPPNAMWWPVISEGVGDDDAALRAWAETLAIWTSTHEPGSRKGGYNLGNVRGMLDAFGEARSKARGAHSSTNGGLRDLNALIAEEDRRGY